MPRSPDAPHVAVGIQPDGASSGTVRRDFERLLDRGFRLTPAGTAKDQPDVLRQPRYLPRSRIRLFGWTFYLSGLLYDQALSFFIAHVQGPRRRRLVPRVFYKDSSLIWRVASHFVHDEHEYWIGKGAVEWVERRDGAWLHTLEETTNLPFEMQGALDAASRRQARRRDDRAVELVLRRGPSGRAAPYRDFTAPRERAVAARGQLNGGRSVARFERAGDPESLRFTRGFEPDLDRGVIEVTVAGSRFFGGELQKHRVLSRNGRIQYLFMSTPVACWLNPPQTLTCELSDYGVRVDDVFVPDELTVPAWEYHEHGEDGEVSHSQIPEGFAGDAHPDDPDRADARAWVDRLPVIRAFRRQILGRD